MHEEYAVSISFRRGSTTEAENQNVSAADIARNQRWRKAEAIGTRNARVFMRDHDADVQLALKVFVKYSKVLKISSLKDVLYPDHQNTKVSYHTVTKEGFKRRVALFSKRYTT